MRCKVVCVGIKPSVDGSEIQFMPVVGDSAENKEFFRYTPSGSITFGLVNLATANKFEEGKEYYVDFSPA